MESCSGYCCLAVRAKELVLLKREILKIAGVVSLAALFIGLLLSWWRLTAHHAAG